jgi:ribonuclease P protein component
LSADGLRRSALRGPDFERILSRPPFSRGRHFLVYRSAAGSVGPARLGTVVPLRKAGNAVQRNYVKRCIREAFRRQAARLSGQDVVVVLRATFRRPDAPALRTELARLMGNLA